MRARDSDWEGVRLHVVTGKGGTGKTTVAAALALALAAGGKRVLLMEVEGRQGIAQLFDVPPLPYSERKVAVAPAADGRPGGDVYALVADPESALVEYLEMFYSLRHAGTALTRLGVTDFATTIAPGLRDVLLTGKAAEAVRRKTSGQPAYGAIVMDAPPTGRIGRFLNVTAEVSGLAKVGPIRGHAETVSKVIRSPQTVVHFVSLLEEMPVQETLDGIAELQQIGGGGIRPGAIMINMLRRTELATDEPRWDAVRASRPAGIGSGAGPAGAGAGPAGAGASPAGRGANAAAQAAEPAAQTAQPVDPPPDGGRVDIDELAVGLKTAGFDDACQLAADLAAELGDEQHAAAGRQLQHGRLVEAGRPTYELPFLADGIDVAGLYRLAAALRDQGAA